MIMIIYAFVCILHVSLSIHFTDRCEYFTAVSTKALSYLELIVERCPSLKITMRHFTVKIRDRISISRFDTFGEGINCSAITNRIPSITCLPRVLERRNPTWNQLKGSAAK